jgi:ammonia channel protein AmtB
LVPLFHYVLFSFILLILITSIVNLYHQFYNPATHLLSAMFVVLSFALVLIAWFTRTFALKAQDRAIRAEENLRHFVLTGKLLDQKLTIQQIVALRFASDAEFVSLAQKAVANNMSNKEIKMAITNWKADENRV